MTTLFEQLGGRDAVEAAVEIFYKKVLADDTIKHYFTTVDMAKQRMSMKAFLTMAFGGPNGYTGEDMREAHKDMHLKESDFTAVAGHLTATLNDLNVPQNLVDEVMTIAGSVHDDVLNI